MWLEISELGIKISVFCLGTGKMRVLDLMTFDGVRPEDAIVEMYRLYINKLFCLGGVKRDQEYYMI